MAVRPPQIRYLTEGKAIGADSHKGFAATWNWLLAWVNFFKAGKGLKLSDTGSGHPRLDVQIEGGEGIEVTCSGDGQSYVINSLGSSTGGGGGGSRFHFAYSAETGEGSTTVTIGEGAVQLGGFTHFIASGNVNYMGSGTQWICVVVDLSDGSGRFVAYSNVSALNAAQLDVSKYVFPIYKVVDYEVVLDYRPLPNAGVWEDETLVQVAP